MITIYKTDTSGKLRFLTASTESSDLIQTSGVVDTDKPVTHRKTCSRKNIGRSNETSPEDQAILEMNSLISGKLTEGYFKTINEAQNEVVILPMLAKSYDDEKHKIDWTKPVYIQPKFDGMRCLAFVTGGEVLLMSRQGKTIETVQHIVKELSKFPDGVYDGELYAVSSFQENMRLIKKYRKGETEKVLYHIYDMVSDNGFSERSMAISKIVNNFNSIVKVETVEIANESLINFHHSKFLAEGYEGSIIRHSNDGYKVNGRSSNLLKYKDFKDLALPIMDIVPGDANPLHGYPIFYWKGSEGHHLGDDILGAGIKYSHKEREEFLINKHNYIGKTAELRFFEYSDSGVPRFPVMIGIREDK